MMAFLRRLFGDRRKAASGDIEADRRRKSAWRRWKDSGERLDHAVEALDKTVRLNTAEFAALLHRSREYELKLVQNGAAKAVEFQTFAEICRFRYSPEGSLMTLCKNPEHEASHSGIAPCQRNVCPFYTVRK